MMFGERDRSRKGGKVFGAGEGGVAFVMATPLQTGSPTRLAEAIR